MHVFQNIVRLIVIYQVRTFGVSATIRGDNSLVLSCAYIIYIYHVMTLLHPGLHDSNRVNSLVRHVKFCIPKVVTTILWCVLSGPPLRFADVRAMGPWRLTM